jgi:translation initiation factor IF-1
LNFAGTAPIYPAPVQFLPSDAASRENQIAGTGNTQMQITARPGLRHCPAEDYVLAKEELIELTGMVDEVLPNSFCRVTLENGASITAYTNGKMKMRRIRVLAGDRVTVEISPYDITKGRINFRHKDTTAPPPSAGRPHFHQRKR